jgi:hypothetical protein
MMGQHNGAGAVITAEAQAAGLDLMATFGVSLSAIAGQLAKADRDRSELLNAIYPVEIPAQQVKVTGGGVLSVSSAELMGPRSGWYWDVRRVTVTGLASSSEIVTLYRGSSGSSADAQVQNVVTTLTGPTGTYGAGLGAFMLRAGQSIIVGGSSLTASELVTVTADAIAVAAPYIGAYLL